MNFCKFVGNSYPHTPINFCTFVLIFHQIASKFPRVPIVFTLSILSIHPENENAVYINFLEMTSFFRHRVS